MSGIVAVGFDGSEAAKPALRWAAVMPLRLPLAAPVEAAACLFLDPEGLPGLRPLRTAGSSAPVNCCR